MKHIHKWELANMEWAVLRDNIVGYGIITNILGKSAWLERWYATTLSSVIPAMPSDSPIPIKQKE